jgi:hypothetical protein
LKKWLFGVKFFPCQKTGHLRQKRDNPVKNRTSGHRPPGHPVLFRTLPGPSQALIFSCQCHVTSSFFPFISFHVLLSRPPTLSYVHWSPSSHKAQPLLPLSLSCCPFPTSKASSPTGSLALAWFWPSSWVWPRLCLYWLVSLSLTNSSCAVHLLPWW